MSLIIFTPLRRKTFKLIIFILISNLTFYIPRAINGFGPYDLDIIDALSQLVISFPFFFRKCYRKKPILEKSKNFNKKDIIIFILVIIIHFIFITINIIYDNTLEYFSNLFNTYNVFMLFSTIVSIYIFNSGYFRHHFIGQTIFLISASINDIYSYSFHKGDLQLDWKHITIATLDWMTECIVIAYKKYLMEIKYMSPYLISFIIGICSLIYVLSLYFLSFFNRDVICFNDSCFKIFSFNSEVFQNKIYLIFTVIVSIICVITFYIIDYNIIYSFSICHSLLSFYFRAVIDNIINVRNHNASFGAWIILILSIIFLLIGVSIYLEIIELNFCKLNENTRRKIESRGKEADILKTYMIGEEEDEEGNQRDSAKYAIEFEPGYEIEL